MENRIEAYLRNELSPLEKKSFENEMGTNPHLAEEVAFQSDLIQAIQMNRKAELKARLQNVKVSPLQSSKMYINVAAIVTGISLLSVGAYYYITRNVQETTQKETVTITQPVTSPSNSTTLATAQTNTSTVATKATNNQSIANTASTQTKTNKNNSYTSSNQEIKNHNTSELQEADMMEEHNVDFSASELNVPTINDKESTKGNRVQNIDIKEIKDTNVGYTYYNNQLYLYGDFGNNPYELVELNNKQKKHLYIAMNDHFYELHQGKSTFTKFVAITDKAIIQQLTILKNQH
jgi:hypothetical protein